MSDMPEAVRRVLDELVASIRATLGDRLVGLYLYGSLLWGDFDPEASDLDLVAVLSDDVTDPRFEQLDAMHHAVVHAHPTWANGSTSCISGGRPWLASDTAKDLLR
jgi:predicted nucleotidyltransferase